jgi:hypothetical protein
MDPELSHILRNYKATRTIIEVYQIDNAFGVFGGALGAAVAVRRAQRRRRALRHHTLDWRRELCV